MTHWGNQGGAIDTHAKIRNEIYQTAEQVYKRGNLVMIDTTTGLWDISSTTYAQVTYGVINDTLDEEAPSQAVSVTIEGLCNVYVDAELSGYGVPLVPSTVNEGQLREAVLTGETPDDPEMIVAYGYTLGSANGLCTVEFKGCR